MLAKVIDRVLSWLLPTSKKGSIHRYYVHRGGDDGRWGLFIHRIVKSDDKGVFHNHPWDGVAFVFGSYLEETPTSTPRRVWLLNKIGNRRSHRVEIRKPVWTIFLHFRRKDGGRWWFHDRAGNRIDGKGEGHAENPWRGPDLKVV